MDAQTVSAFAAAAAAGAAAVVAGVQFYVGHRQSKAALQSAQAAMKNAANAGRHKVAEFRQTWIDNVIDALSEHHAILSTTGNAPGSDRKALAALRTRLEILLNPNEETTVDLLQLIDQLGQAETDAERKKISDEMISVARSLLKTEWVRIKEELQ